MKIVRTIDEVRQAVAEARRDGAKQVGLMPTLGAMHAGHFSLIDAARTGCDFVVVSLFVNPTQFGPGEDYETYPRTWDADRAVCEQRGVDMLWAPTPEVMYPEGSVTSVHVADLTERLCGAARCGHFDGVCTVVAKLLNAVGPDVAYFGRKDYQQLVIIRRMVADLDMPVRIEACPTVRDEDGLALSSRNARLNPQERAQAAALSQALRQAEARVAGGPCQARQVADDIRAHIAAAAPLGDVDYVEIVDPDTLVGVERIDRPVVAAVAVRFPSARLIDNVLLTPPGGDD